MRLRSITQFLLRVQEAGVAFSLRVTHSKVRSENVAFTIDINRPPSHEHDGRLNTRALTCSKQFIKFTKLD